MNTHKMRAMKLVGPIYIEQNFFNLINSKSNLMAFLYSVFHADSEYNIFKKFNKKKYHDFCIKSEIIVANATFSVIQVLTVFSSQTVIESK